MFKKKENGFSLVELAVAAAIATALAVVAVTVVTGTATSVSEKGSSAAAAETCTISESLKGGTDETINDCGTATSGSQSNAVTISLDGGSIAYGDQTSAAAMGGLYVKTEGLAQVTEITNAGSTGWTVTYSMGTMSYTYDAQVTTSTQDPTYISFSPDWATYDYSGLGNAGFTAFSYSVTSITLDVAAKTLVLNL